MFGKARYWIFFSYSRVRISLLLSSAVSYYTIRINKETHTQRVRERDVRGDPVSSLSIHLQKKHNIVSARIIHNSKHNIDRKVIEACSKITKTMELNIYNKNLRKAWATFIKKILVKRKQYQGSIFRLALPTHSSHWHYK